MAVISDHLFSLVWHMRTHGSEPFEGINCMFEPPLSTCTWIDEGKLKVKIIDFIRATYELLLIRRQYRDALNLK